MAGQHEVEQPQDLLDSQGHIVEPGWARTPVWRYNRNAIKASALRIKEWDYYLITGSESGFAITVSDLGFAGMISASLLDFEHGTETTKTLLAPCTLGHWKLPASSQTGDVKVNIKGGWVQYLVTDDSRRILASIDNFQDGVTLRADITLTPTMSDSMNIATPWAETPTRFYYNRKINALRAAGWVDCGHRIDFSPDTNFGVLDWGRGVWTYKNRWFWATGSGLVAGKPFGLNLGYGFSDRSSASENMVFYNGVAHKLTDVDFGIPRDTDNTAHYLEPWHFTSPDHRFEGVFMPILDRASNMDFKLIQSDQHQVFGRFTGQLILDGGEHLRLDNFLMAAEEVYNKY